MDNVPTLAIQAPIVRKLLEMLSPVTISTQMSLDIVTKIVGESQEMVRNWADNKLKGDAAIRNIRVFQ
jgi:hypothetical protein